MSIQSESAADDEEEQEEQQNQPPAYHPSAPSDALFDISTTVDPSYVISLIRKLLPSGISSISIGSYGVDSCDSLAQGSKGEGTEESVFLPSENGIVKSSNGEYEAMDTVNDYGEIDGQEGKDASSHQDEGARASVGEEAWEEYGCILWDLASSKTHAELMVQNLVLEVLLASLMVSQSARVTEIGLGIIGNLACHEVSRKHIASTKGLVEVIVDQLFLDDTQCLCEACRSKGGGRPVYRSHDYTELKCREWKRITNHLFMLQSPKGLYNVKKFPSCIGYPNKLCNTQNV